MSPEEPRFVYSANDGHIGMGTPAGFRMKPNDVWYADDPFVLARPDLFSTTPVLVHSTDGREPRLAPTPLPQKRRARLRG